MAWSEHQTRDHRGLGPATAVGRWGGGVQGSSGGAVPRGRDVHHLDSAACEAKGHGPDGALAAVVHQVIDLGQCHVCGGRRGREGGRHVGGGGQTAGRMDRSGHRHTDGGRRSVDQYGAGGSTSDGFDQFVTRTKHWQSLRATALSRRVTATRQWALLVRTVVAAAAAAAAVRWCVLSRPPQCVLPVGCPCRVCVKWDEGRGNITVD